MRRMPLDVHSAVGRLALVLLLCVATPLRAFPEQGKWDFVMSPQIHDMIMPKSLFAGSKIYVQITCDSPDSKTEVIITWSLTQNLCWYLRNDHYENTLPLLAVNKTFQIATPRNRYPCYGGNHIILDTKTFVSTAPMPEVAELIPEQVPEQSRARRGTSNLDDRKDQPIYTTTKDGAYMFALSMRSTEEQLPQEFTASVHIEMRDANGYLSAVDFPLLQFYGAMCIVYLVFGLIWLLVSFMQWRDLLRIQFWIGGVILLGMLEKAMFYAEYHAISTDGVSVTNVVLMAEWVSCAKRTLARMLVVIVSLGFGIVKPRLGPMLHRVVGTGALYFVLACVESYMRLTNASNDPSNKILVASVPLAVLDSAICWWIFTSLVQTTRTLRLRRNMVKLTLYRHFTNTLIFAVVASIVFMLYAIKVHRSDLCLVEWKTLWQEDAFWHLLFSALLLVIMILWRPTNNNQRYAFTPLLDNPEDEDEEDDEEEHFVSDAYGVKLRGQSRTQLLPKKTEKTTTNEEDDLRWVEENIPQAISDVVLPVLDSDEEIINTKFEVSKMQ